MNLQKNGEKSKMVTGTIVTIAGGILWGVSAVYADSTCFKTKE